MTLAHLSKFGNAIAARLRGKSAGQGEAAPDESSTAPRDKFCAAAQALGPHARVLDVGTKQVVPGRSTHSMHLFPHVPRSNYLLADMEPGDDVDVVADIHCMPADWTNRFDAFVAMAVFEHVARPWIAAQEIARVLAPGGICYISTCQTFPLHAYPHDYFRFSREALALIFQDAGMRVVECAYQHRAKISAPNDFVPLSYQETWNATWPSYLVVNLFAEKPR